MTLAFVTPWFGPDATGGAETACRQTVERLAAAGLDVEVLTTCSKSFLAEWDKDHYPPGLETFNGIKVRRFRVKKRDRARFDALNQRLLAHQAISGDEEVAFMDDMIHSPDLVEHMRRRAAQDVFFLIPYLYGTTLAGALAVPDRSVLIPCLHDEPYARLAPIRTMFERVRGWGFLSPEERRLADDLYGARPGVGRFLGLGVDFRQGDAGRFRAKHGADPFVLYIGRKDAGKGTPVLVDAFLRYKARRPGPLKLYLAGPGTEDIRGSADIRDLGFLPEQDKYDAFAAATVFCNPSTNESFSIVLMEAWLAGVPGLVREQCEVTTGHVRAASGGLYFGDDEEFGEALDLLVERPDLRARMAANGRKYVELNYSWDVVIRRYMDALQHWGLASDAARSAS